MGTTGMGIAVQYKPLKNKNNKRPMFTEFRIPTLKMFDLNRDRNPRDLVE